MSYSLTDFLKSFVKEHALTSGGEIVLDVSPEEMQALGDFFVRGICGWMLGLEADRTRPKLVEVTRLVEVTPADGQREDESRGEIDKEEIDKREDPIN